MQRSKRLYEPRQILRATLVNNVDILSQSGGSMRNCRYAADEDVVNGALVEGLEDSREIVHRA